MIGRVAVEEDENENEEVREENNSELSLACLKYLNIA